jgi:hypothetical protein
VNVLEPLPPSTTTLGTENSSPPVVPSVIESPPAPVWRLSVCTLALTLAWKAIDGMYISVG